MIFPVVFLDLQDLDIDLLPIEYNLFMFLLQF